MHVGILGLLDGKARLPCRRLEAVYMNLISHQLLSLCIDITSFLWPVPFGWMSFAKTLISKTFYEARACNAKKATLHRF